MDSKRVVLENLQELLRSRRWGLEGIAGSKSLRVRERETGKSSFDTGRDELVLVIVGGEREREAGGRHRSVLFTHP